MTKARKATQTKRTLTSIMTIVMLFVSIFSILPTSITANAAVPIDKSIRGYAIPNYNIPAYLDSNLTKREGTIYPTDEIYISGQSGGVTSKSILCAYKVTGTNNYKVRWVNINYILSSTRGKNVKCTAYVTVYKRPNAAKYGTVYPNDSCWVNKVTTGDYVQLKYPVGQNVYKVGFIRTSDAIKYFPGYSPDNSNNSNTNSKGTVLLNYAKTQLGKTISSYSGEGFHFRAWCADFVSFCARKTGCSYAIPTNSSVDGIWKAIKNKGGKEYSKSTIKSGKYTPKAGDIIIFKSSGASHVGIVSHCQNGRVYYIDGNNTTKGNGYKATVHSSNCSVSDSRFTCILHPNF